mgnify:CR=1 FL=1
MTLPIVLLIIAVILVLWIIGMFLGVPILGIVAAIWRSLIAVMSDREHALAIQGLTLVEAKSASVDPGSGGPDPGGPHPAGPDPAGKPGDRHEIRRATSSDRANRSRKTSGS